MQGSTFFSELRDALLREEEQHARLSDQTRISLASLWDLANKKDEWYAVVPLYKLRFLCSLIGVDFDGAFSVPAYEHRFKSEWAQRLAQVPSSVIEQSYMKDEFWAFLRDGIRVLDLYPFQWSDDVSRMIGYDVRSLLTLLALKD